MAASERKKLKEDGLSFFDEEDNIEVARKNLERRKMLKISGLILLGTVATTAGLSYGIGKYNEANLLEMKEIQNSSRIKDVLVKLDKMRSEGTKLQVDGMSKMANLTQEMQLATLFNLKTNIQNIEKSRVEAWKNFQIEFENVEKNLKSFDKALSTKTDEQIAESMRELTYYKNLLTEVEKGFVSSKDTNQMLFSNFENFKSINANIDSLSNQLKELKEEVVGTVLQKVKTGDYNLNATTNALIQDVKENSKIKDKEVLDIYNEIKGSEFEKDFNQNDVIEARKSVAQLEDAVIGRVLDDQRAIEGLISKVKNGEELKQGDLPAEMLAAAPVAPTSSSHSSGGWGFFEYYLLYNWLAGGSHSTPAMAASHTSSFAATSGRNLQKKENGAYIPPAVVHQSAVKTMSNTAPSPAYNNYNVRNQNSYLNSTLNNNWGRTNSPANSNNAQKFQQAQKKLNEVKLKGQRATSARQAEMRRVAEVRARAEAARVRASSTSTSRSSVSVSRGGGGGS